MQIILTSKISIIAIILISFSFNVNADSFPGEPIVLNLNEGSNVTITSKRKIIYAEYHNDKSSKLIKLNDDLTSHLTKTDEAVFILKVHSNRDLFVVLSREPSKQNRTASFCGAGYEDYLILIEATKKRILLLDKLLLQSCLKSILLQTDNGDDPLKAITIDKENSSILFQWLGESEDIKRSLTIKNGHFELR